MVTSFSVTEKRIVSYNPVLAKKQTAETLKMADKASNYASYKKMTREELGDSACKQLSLCCIGRLVDRKYRSVRSTGRKHILDYRHSANAGKTAIK